MASYYKSNAIYHHIQSNGLDKFKFCSGNIWQLVYGDHACVPKLFVLAIGCDKTQLEVPLSPLEDNAYQHLKFLSDRNGIPVIVVKFDSESSAIDGAFVRQASVNPMNPISLLELSQLYSSFGLPVSNSSTGKHLNDRTSSA